VDLAGLLVGRFVDLGVHDDAHVDALVDRFLELVRHRRVAELVEAAAQGVAFPGLPDEAQQGLVEVAAEPLQGFLALFGRQLVRLQVAIFHGVRLTAGDAAIEEDVVLERAEQRLRVHAELDRWRAAVEVLGRALDGEEGVLVVAAGLGGEVVPDEALHGVLPGRATRIPARVRHHRAEHLEARHDVALVLLRVEALDGEAQQPLARPRVRHDAEGHGVDASHREHLIPAGFLRLESQGSPPGQRLPLIRSQLRSLAEGRQ
jgi:hypothetical protein